MGVVNSADICGVAGVVARSHGDTPVGRECRRSSARLCVVAWSPNTAAIGTRGPAMANILLMTEEAGIPLLSALESDIGVVRDTLLAGEVVASCLKNLETLRTGTRSGNKH
jgi:hypothetical protein